MVPLVVLGPDYDSLFCKPQCELEREVSEFNQSTRVWLGVKFVRKLPIDFSANAKLNFRYSSRKICELLDVNRTTVYRLINDVRHKNVSVLRMAFVITTYRLLNTVHSVKKNISDELLPIIRIWLIAIFSFAPKKILNGVHIKRNNLSTSVWFRLGFGKNTWKYIWFRFGFSKQLEICHFVKLVMVQILWE